MSVRMVVVADAALLQPLGLNEDLTIELPLSGEAQYLFGPLKGKCMRLCGEGGFIFQQSA